MMASANPNVRLSALLAGLIDTPLADDPQIEGLTLDSRSVQPGWLFIAVPGVRADGRAYLAGAYGRGAAAAVYEEKNFSSDSRYTNAIAVKNLREHIGTIADRFTVHRHAACR